MRKEIDMIAACPSEKSEEILAFLRTHFDIPDNLTSLELRVAVDEVITVKCTYAPDFKESNGRA